MKKILCFVILMLVVVSLAIANDEYNMYNGVLKLDSSGAIVNRTTANTTSFLRTLILTLSSSSNMADTFGPSLEFRIADNAYTPSEMLAGIVAARYGADNTGIMRFYTTNSSTPADHMSIDNVGRTNIYGTSLPQFDVNSTVSYASGARSVAFLKLTSTTNMIDSFGPSLGFRIYDNTFSALEDLASISAVRNGADRTGLLQFSVTNAGSVGVRATLDENGVFNVTGDLTVSGVSCCDYVFEEAYDLMKLDDLSKFVADNRHLPGMTINDTDRTSLRKSVEELLVKVEEQSLYILQLHERIKELENSSVKTADRQVIELLQMTTKD